MRAFDPYWVVEEAWMRNSIRRHLFCGLFGLVLLGMRPAACCGLNETIETHDDTRMTMSVAGTVTGAKAVLVLLVGGTGYLALDGSGCPQRLKGNALITKRPLFHEAGYMTVLVDAPTDRHGKEGLGGFRIEAQHAADLGRVIAGMRAQTRLPVWLIGTSRGAISAVNAASRLSGAAAPDGLILTSPVTSGREGAIKAWVAHSVFSLDLEDIKMPVLVIVHAEDKCIRTPPDRGKVILEKTEGVREQFVTVTGGPGWEGGKGLKACRGKSPHGFVTQDAEVAAGMIRFIETGAY